MKQSNFPGRKHEKRQGALDRVREARQTKPTGLTAEQLEKRHARQDKEIAHLETIQAGDINPIARRSKINRG